MGEAGASAAREFERRRDKRHERVLSGHPRLGKLLLAVFDEPQSTKAWGQGAAGEETVGASLRAISSESLRVLNDRRIPGSRANIDHLVVTAHGVYVIDAKRYVGKRPTRRVDGGLFNPRREVLLVDGRDRTQLVEGVRKQVRLVKEVLAGQPDVPVRGVLCFVEADWPLIGGSLTVEGVQVTYPRRLRAILGEAGNLGSDRIADLQLALYQAFPRSGA